jgi:1-deoxy-D-xylulose-5-phosphate reductoisomerase
MSVAGRRRVVLLGSTGSIGRQTIEVMQSNAARFELIGVVAGRDAATLERQIESMRVPHYGLGTDAAVALATLDEADVVLNAVVGVAGLRASVAALEAGKTLALANKESLVAGGEACRAAAVRGGGRIVPVDSEHAAIAQCLRGRDHQTVSRIVLTASGGPFLHRLDLDSITVEEALRHPTWSMGPKITIDSATLMNKGLEVIEAHHLFGFDYDSIGVLVHPQSIVHGIVELRDSSTLLHAAPTDMRLPIQAALCFPQPAGSFGKPVSLESVGRLEFADVDHERFVSVRLAYEAGRRGKSFPAVLNAANEEAVRAFLDKAIDFKDIPLVIESVLACHDPVEVADIDAVLEIDSEARRAAARLIESRRGAAPVGGAR